MRPGSPRNPRPACGGSSASMATWACGSPTPRSFSICSTGWRASKPSCRSCAASSRNPRSVFPAQPSRHVDRPHAMQQRRDPQIARSLAEGAEKLSDREDRGEHSPVRARARADPEVHEMKRPEGEYEVGGQHARNRAETAHQLRLERAAVDELLCDSPEES